MQSLFAKKATKYNILRNYKIKENLHLKSLISQLVHKNLNPIFPPHNRNKGK